MPSLTDRLPGARTNLRADSDSRSRRETIVKIKKRTHPFAMIDARALNDPRISWKAKGLHAYLMSKPKDWHVIFADLVKHATDRAYSVRTALNELLGLGYAKLQPLKDERGLFCGSCWTVYEWPEQFLAQSGDDGFPNLGKIGVSGKEESRETGVSGEPNPTNNEYPSNPTNKDRTSKRVIAPHGERQLLGQIAGILGEVEMKKNGGMWRKRIRRGPAERRALRDTIEDYKLRTPDQRRRIRNHGAWFTDRYLRNLVKITAAANRTGKTAKA